MGVITLTGGRGYQDIGTVGQTVQQLAGNVQSINQILDVGLRNSRDYQNGWIRVSDMIGLGICKLINTDQLQYIPAEGTSLTASDSLVVTAGNLTLVNDSADPGDNKFYGTNASGTLGWYSVSEGAFYTGIDSIDVSGTQISLVNDSADPGSDMYYGTNASGTLGWYSQPMDLAYIGIDSVHISGADVSLVNDSADPGSDMFYGTNASGTLGWYAQTTSGGTVTSIGSTTLTIAGTSSVPTVNLSGTQVTDIGLGGTALQPGSAVTSITSSSLTVGGTATVPTIDLTAAVASANATYYPIFASALSGAVSANVNSGLAYNPGLAVVAIYGQIQSIASTAVTAIEVGGTLNSQAATTSFGDYGTYGPTVTTLVSYISSPNISATTALTTRRGFQVNNPSITAGGSMTTCVGYDCEDMGPATTIIGFQGKVTSSAGKWNLYMSGTAANYFAGHVLVGSNTDSGSGAILQVTGNATVSGTLLIGGVAPLVPGAIQNMESAGWNSSSGAVQTALTVPQDILIPFACTLREVDVLTQGTGSCTVTILRGAAVAGAITMPPTADITGGANVTCAALSKQIGAAYATTLAGWTTAFGQNDVLRLTLTANTGFTSVKVILRMY